MENEMNKIKKVWVFSEKQATLAGLCSGGRQLGEEVSAVLLGSKEEAETAFAFGADKVYWLGEPKPKKMFEDYTDTIRRLLRDEAPDLFMVQATKRGKLLAGRLAAGLGTSVLVDATEIKQDAEAIYVKHRVYGGAAFRTERALSPTTIATVGPGVFTIWPEDATRQGSVIEVPFAEPAFTIRLLETKNKACTEVNLAAAKRVVGVGRGLASQNDIKMVEELAALIGAEIGCSRPLAEGVNWLPRERYIGVSGAMLKPEVYLAVGISGQVQHMVGANQARVMIAINKDKGAPIFQQADYGIVGDLYKVLPMLKEMIKANL
jgi:electron transfer flavoprotein alpha subunit